MTRLHDALNDLAEQAPLVDLTGSVLARTRRRRQARLFAVPAVAACVAAIVAVGVLVGGGQPAVGPALVQLKDLPKDVLNTGAVPGPLPAGRVEPVKFAYLDGCKKQAHLEPGTGECAQWRLVGRSGKQWRLADALAAPPVVSDSGGSDTPRPQGPLEISDDGRRIAYYRPADEHFVVRDLLSGDVTVIAQRVPLASLQQAALIFSGNGQRLAISFAAAEPRHALLADTATGAVHELPGYRVVGLGNDASTVTLLEPKNGRMTLLLTGPDGTLRNQVPLDPDVHVTGVGNLVAPDGHTLVTVPGAGEDQPTPVQTPESLNTVKLVDVRTGKVVGTRSLRLPENSELAHIERWVGKSTIVIAVPSHDAPTRTVGNLFIMEDRRYLTELNTGRTRVFGTIKLQAAQMMTRFGGFRR
jgi:hypothetical protein